ncbi:serine/threonine protein kinase, partial [Streptomyces europaeiscabiei]|nr:serine/threonine protein kinase [Streptomyces europaeiscabiei]
ARTLAPQGAAPLVTAGWLPGPLVEQVGRSAVQLLNLDAAEEVPSGPVGFSSPSVGTAGTGESPAATPPGDARAEAPATSGVFGPPPVMSPSAPPVTHVPGQRADAVVADTVPPEAPAPQSAPGRLSLSVAATSTSTANGRGRKVSCSVALAIAGAFAMVSVGALFGLGVLQGEDEKGDTAGKKPSASSSSNDENQYSEQPGDTEGELPEKYLGTWEGEGYALGGNLPAGTFTVTLEQASVGDPLGTFRSVDLLGGTCDDKLVLKKVTRNSILATSIADTKNNPGTCTKNTHEITLTPVGAELQYTSKNADAGDPTARLAKVK